MTVLPPFTDLPADLGALGDGGVCSIDVLALEDVGSLAAAFADMEPWRSYPFSSASLMSYLGGQEPGAPRLALRLEARTVGVIGLRLNWLRGPYVQFLGVLPDAQGAGLGGLALGYAEAEARRGAERNIWVAVSDFNRRARAFYERAGYEVAAELLDLVKEGRAEILMRKRLRD